MDASNGVGEWVQLPMGGWLWCAYRPPEERLVLYVRGNLAWAMEERRCRADFSLITKVKHTDQRSKANSQATTERTTKLSIKEPGHFLLVKLLTAI